MKNILNVFGLSLRIALLGGGAVMVTRDAEATNFPLARRGVSAAIALLGDALLVS